MCVKKEKFKRVGTSRYVTTAGREVDVPGYVWYGHYRVKDNVQVVGLGFWEEHQV